MPAETTTPVGRASQDSQRRSSPAKFAALSGYKRDAKPEEFKQRSDSTNEMRTEPKTFLAGLWDSPDISMSASGEHSATPHHPKKYLEQSHVTAEAPPPLANTASMATVLPPPSKRQRREENERAATTISLPQIPDGLQRIQFRDADTGAPQGPVVSVALTDLSPKNLSLLLNSLLGHTDPADRLPYRFYNPLTNKDDGQSATGEFSQEQIIKAYIDGTTTTELQLNIPCRAEAIFRVNPITRCSSSISGHGEAILTAAFSPATSTRLATGGGDKTARIWDCETGTPLFTLKGHTGWVLTLAWSPDGKILATGSMDNTIRLWDPATGLPLGNPLKGHTKWITSLTWEPYHLTQPGRPRLASASKDSTIRIWDVVSGHTDLALTGHKNSVACVKWGGSGWLYTCSQDRTVKIWSAATGKLVHSLESHAHWVNHLALSTDHVLKSGFYDEKGLKSIPATPEAKREKALQRYNTALASAGGAERLVTASDDCTMYLWNPSGATPTKPVQRMIGHQKPINHLAFSPSGTTIASCGFDNHVKLWDAATGTFITTLRGHVGAVYMCCFSPDSRLLVTASKDTTIKVWDVRTGKLRENLPGHADEVYAVDWGGDGERVGSGGRDKAVRIWRN
ncbi:ribosome assembly [Elasticomyces elasticus]|nr:ribosome assembly [Elasticomyces elasticus]